MHNFPKDLVIFLRTLILYIISTSTALHFSNYSMTYTLLALIPHYSSANHTVVHT